MVVGGTLFFAGWSPGDDVKPPSYDALLKDAEEEPQGYITKAGLNRVFLKGMMDSDDFNHNTQGLDQLPGRLKGMFTSHDWNHDGKLSRDEWDESVKLLGSSKNSAFALKLGGSGDVTESHVLWKQKSGLPYVPSGLVYGGQYILLKEGGVVTIYDTQTGKRVFQKRAAPSGRYYASPVAANGYIYFTSLDDGVITVMKVGGDKPEIVVKNPSLEERVVATPVIADNTLYVRTAGHLYAFAETR